MKTIGNMPNVSMGLCCAALVQDIKEYLFFAGKTYSFEDYFTIGDMETSTIVVDPTAFTGDRLTFMPLVSYALGGPILIDFYASTVADSDGLLLASSNRRINFPAAKTILRLNPTIISIGSRFAGDIIPSTGQNAPSASGANNIETIRFEISKNIKYAITLKNNDGANAIVQIKLTWFEE